MAEMRRILLTGCSGYIGRTIVPHLKQRGFSVFGFDRKPYPYANLNGFIQGDLKEDASLRRIPKHVDTVCHLAAAKDDWGLSDQEYFHDNVTATRKLLDFGHERGIRNWLFFSSVGVLGSSATPLDESASFTPSTAYGESKAEGEKLFHELAVNDPSVRVIIMRPSVVFGPNNPPNTNVYRLIESIYKNRFVMVGKGDVIKTTSYIENLIACTLFLIERMQETVQPFIYVDEPRLSTVEFVRLICRFLQRKPPKWKIPLRIAAPLAHLADFGAALTGKDFPITAARIKKFCAATNYDGSAVRNLGFEQPVPIEDALRRTVHWYLTGR